jgi:hypothetical protein
VIIPKVEKPEEAKSQEVKPNADHEKKLEIKDT